MTDVPDVLDERGRLRRLVLALIIGGAVASITYGIANGMAKPDEMPGGFDGGHAARAYQFVGYMTGFFGIAAFIIMLVVAKALARRRERRAYGLPQARKID